MTDPAPEVVTLREVTRDTVDEVLALDGLASQAGRFVRAMRVDRAGTLRPDNAWFSRHLRG